MSNSSDKVYVTSFIARCVALVMTFAVVFGVACSNNQSHNMPLLPATVTEQTKNPLSNLGAAAAAGKPLYAVHCTMCHGDDGKGEGIAGGSLAARPTDLTMGDVVAGPDGKLFLTIKNGVKKEGKPTMPPAQKVADEQIWQIVAYVRTLAKK